MENQEMESRREIRESRKKKERKNLIVVVIIILVFLALVVAAFYVRSRRNNQKTGDEPAATPTPQIVTEVESAVYTNPDDIVWNMDSQTAQVNWTNDAGNTSNMKFIIQNVDTKEAYFESEVITPGESISTFTAALPYTEAGEYEVSLKVVSFDPETGDQNSAVTYKRKLVVE